MNTVKETTLHPDGNEGVDLYPKTNINQVQELPQKLTSIENQINQLNIDKLAKPTTPTADSAVTMLADGTVGTKPLSEIGGKLYLHRVILYFDEAEFNISVVIINTSSEHITDIEYIKLHLVKGTIGNYNDEGRLDAGAVGVYYYSSSDSYHVEGVFIGDGDIISGLRGNFALGHFEDIAVIEV